MSILEDNEELLTAFRWFETRGAPYESWADMNEDEWDSFHTDAHEAIFEVYTEYTYNRKQQLMDEGITLKAYEEWIDGEARSEAIQHVYDSINDLV